MNEQIGFKLEDIDGCEYAWSGTAGKILISFDTDDNDMQTGKILVVYCDGSSRALDLNYAQKLIDENTWKVYR